MDHVFNFRWIGQYLVEIWGFEFRWQMKWKTWFGNCLARSCEIHNNGDSESIFNEYYRHPISYRLPRVSLCNSNHIIASENTVPFQSIRQSRVTALCVLSKIGRCHASRWPVHLTFPQLKPNKAGPSVAGSSFIWLECYAAQHQR